MALYKGIQSLEKIIFSLLEQGTIQLVSNESFILNNQSYVNFKVERLNSLKGDAEVSWRVFDDSDVLQCDLDVGPPAPSYDQCFPGNQKLYLLDIVYIGE